MDINEIRNELMKRGWTQTQLAEKIGVSPDSFRQVLSGGRKLTVQMERHIELLFESTRTVFFAFQVDIPDATCRSWVPGFDQLTPRQQVEAVKAVVKETIGKLAAKGYEAMTDEDRAALEEFIPRTYVPAPDDGELRAADYSDSETPFA